MTKHMIYADTASRTVVIDRILEDGSVVLLTKLTFEQIRNMGFAEFARQTGETLIFDTPELRELLIE